MPITKEQDNIGGPKNCPYCGAKPFVDVVAGVTRWVVEHAPDCWLYDPYGHDVLMKGESLYAWNHRVDEPKPKPYEAKSPILQPALRIGTRVWPGKNYADILTGIRDNGVWDRMSDEPLIIDIGFVTYDGEFLNQQDAYWRAVHCHQILDVYTPQQLRPAMLRTPLP